MLYINIGVRSTRLHFEMDLLYFGAFVYAAMHVGNLLYTLVIFTVSMFLYDLINEM